MSKVIAMKDGKTRSFTQQVWNRLTEDKDKDGKKTGTRDGWKELSKTAVKQLQKDAKKEEGAPASEPAKKPAAPIENNKATSSSMTIDKAVIELKKLNTVKEVEEFTAGEKRASFLTIIDKKLPELNGGEAPAEDTKAEEPAAEETATEGEATADAPAEEEAPAEEAAE